jgi:hypothetical protein
MSVIKERGGKVVFEWSDGRVVINGDSVEFYAPLDDDSRELTYAFGLDTDNFSNVIAAFEEYHI